MRPVQRPVLPKKVASYIQKQQALLDQKRVAIDVDVVAFWQPRRQTQTIGKALEALQKAMGPTEPCMYCVDNHGTDIEHFWPKSIYLERIFDWNNWLLCCTECGRIKGNQFPLDENNQPLLVDPTVEDPWSYIDFEPATGNLVPRFDLIANDWLKKGTETVRVLQLNCREALSARYRKTYRRLCTTAHEILENQHLEPLLAVQKLMAADDHLQLLSWCIQGAGQAQNPFAELHADHPEIWALCVEKLS